MMRIILSALLACALPAVLLVACADLEPVSEAPQSTVTGRVWPEPPVAPRIRYIATISRPQDVGIRPSLLGRFMRVLGGADEQQFVRPTGVAARGDRLLVTDPGARSVWLIDRAAGRFQRIQQAYGAALASPVAVTNGPGDGFAVADSLLGRVVLYDRQGRPTGEIAPARMQRPAGIAYDAGRRRLYVADSGAHTIWIIDEQGGVVDSFGTRGSGASQFNFPTHVALDADGLVYVTDGLGYRVEVFTTDGKYIREFGQHGNVSGDMAAPKGLGVDAWGHVYVVDALFDTVQIFDQHGSLLLNFGERGTQAGQFWLPGGLCIVAGKLIYVADSYNRRVQLFEYMDAGDDS